MKSILVALIIFGVVFTLSSLILRFSLIGDIFAVNLDFSIKVISLMLLVMYLFTLSTGVWDKWEQYVIIPVPTALGVAIASFIFSQTYAPFMGLFFLIFPALYVFNSNKIKRLLIKFKPNLIMKPALKGTMFLFGVFSGVLIMLNPTQVESLNVGEKIGTIIEEPLKQTVTKQVPLELQPLLLSEIDFKALAETQINKFVEPYKKYKAPATAVVAFLLFQFLGSMAYLIYTLTIRIIMWAAVKTKLIRVELVEVQQEILKF